MPTTFVFFQLFVCKLKGFNLFHIWEQLLRHPEPSAPFENHLSKSHKQFQGEDLIVGHKKVCSWHKTEELFKWQKFKKKIGSTSMPFPYSWPRLASLAWLSNLKLQSIQTNERRKRERNLIRSLCTTNITQFRSWIGTVHKKVMSWKHLHVTFVWDCEKGLKSFVSTTRGHGKLRVSS